MDFHLRFPDAPRKVLAASLLVAVLPIASLLGWQVREDLRVQRERTEAELAAAARSLSQATERELVSSLEALQVLSQSELFQQGRIAGLGRLLQGRPRRDWDSVFLLDRDGTVVLDTGPRNAPGALRTIHAQATRRGGAVVLSAQGAPGTPPQPVIAIAIQQPGGVRYVLGARLSETLWLRLLATNPRPAGGIAALFDAQGRLLGHSDAPTRDAALPAGDAAVDMAEATHGVARAGDASGTMVYAAWQRDAVAAWTARVSVPAAPIDGARRRSMWTALSSYGAALLLGLALAWRVGRRALR